MPPKKRTRRTPDQIVADLQAEIQRLKARAAHAKAKKDPTLRQISAAVRAIDKALDATKDAATRTALSDARATVAACLALNGAVPAGGRRALGPKPRRAAPPDPDQVLGYLRKHPGARSEEIASELATDTASLRPSCTVCAMRGRSRSWGRRARRGTRRRSSRPDSTNESWSQCAGCLSTSSSYYNFIRPHSSLRFGREVRTPAMQAPTKDPSAVRRHAAEDLGAASAGRITGDRLPRNSGEEMAQERRGVDQNALQSGLQFQRG